MFQITVCIFVTALSLQILKPAGFMDTSHYPLLLLVYVQHERMFSHTCVRHIWCTHKHTCVKKKFVSTSSADPSPNFTPKFYEDTAVFITGDFLDRVLIRHINLKTCRFVLHSSWIIITLSCPPRSFISISFLRRLNIFYSAAQIQAFQNLAFVLCLHISEKTKYFSVCSLF